MVHINQSESVAKKYLINLGYKPHQVVKNHYTPDFICSDGKRFEVKHLYNNVILFYSTQISRLKPTDTILVCDNDRFISKFLWKNKNNVKFIIKIQNSGTPENHVSINIVIPENIDKYLRIYMGETGIKDKRKAIIKIMEEKFLPDFKRGIKNLMK